MSAGLEIPGQITVRYITHPLNTAAMLNMTIPNGPKGPELHIAGGYTRLENAALEIAKAAAQGAAVESDDVDPQDLGRWAARAASALLAECEVLAASAELRSVIQS